MVDIGVKVVEKVKESKPTNKWIREVYMFRSLGMLGVFGSGWVEESWWDWEILNP
jgi:hypothetical protein